MASQIANLTENQNKMMEDQNLMKEKAEKQDEVIKNLTSDHLNLTV
jgi:hypothetical protein